MVIYNVIALGSLIIWIFSAQGPAGTINPRDHAETLMTFLVVLLIGAVLAGINFAGVGEESTKVNKKTILAGLTFGIVFVLWRVFMEVF